jgi:DNA repair exonuclease SbcCD ATPase subunit
LITLKTLTIKNFRSYPNKELVFNFDNDILTIINGKNGSGKTTILYAILFVIYGKINSKIKQEDVINDINEQNTLVTLTFNKNGNEYMIKRGLTPKVFEVHKDGVMLPLLSSSKDYQSYVDEDIIGISYNLFLKLIMINSTIFAKNFVTLNAGERRDFLEEILSLDILSTITKHIKDKTKLMKTDVTDLEYKMKNAENSIEFARKSLETYTKFISENNITAGDLKKIEEKINSFIVHDIADIEKSNKAYMALKAVIDGNKNKVSKLRSLVDIEKENVEFLETFKKLEINLDWLNKNRIKLKELKTSISDNEKKIQKLTQEKMKLDQRKLNLKQYEHCRGCETLSKIVDIKDYSDTEKSIDSELLKIQEDKTKIEELIAKDKEALSALEERYEKEHEFSSKKNKIELDMHKNKDIIKIYNDLLVDEEKMKSMKYVNIDKFVSENKEQEMLKRNLAETRKKFDQIEDYKKKLAEERSAIARFEKNITELKAKKLVLDEKVESYTNIKDVCENEHVKERMFSQYIPVFNTYVNKYLSDFNIQFKIQLTKSFNFDFTKRGVDVNYSTFSKGEEVRVNLAIVLSFLKIIEVRNVFKTNLLAFDEIDGVLDTENLNIVLGLLSKLSDKKILFITHRNDINMNESYKYEIMKISKDRFTEVSYEK